MKKYFLCILIIITFLNCATERISEGNIYLRNAGEPPTLETSLFKSDQAILSEDAIKRILSSKLELPHRITISIMKFPDKPEHVIRRYGYYYWRVENYIKLQQEYIDILSSKLNESYRVKEVILLPSLITPEEATIPIIREAAVRLQSDLLLVFRIKSDIYQKYRRFIFGKDKLKVFSTVEVVLLDVRTGIIPFTTIVTKEHITFKESEDFSMGEAMLRAEKEVVIKSLKTVGNRLLEFLKSVQ